MNIAIDFDGTIVKHAFPSIGEPMPLAVPVLKALKAAGHKLVLWTAREDEVPYHINKCYLKDAVDWCANQGIVFDAVNETILESDWRGEKTLKRKPHVDWFIDDRNVGGFLGWQTIGQLILGDQAMKIILQENQTNDQVLGLSGIEGQSEILLFKN